MSNKLEDIIRQINCLTEETDSIYHQAAVKLGVSDSVLFILYMIYVNSGKCLLYDIYKSSGISKQTVNSAIRKLENENIVYLEKPSGKNKTVYFTEKGKTYANQTAAKLLKAEYDAFRDWSEDEVEVYLRLTQKYNTSLREQIKML